MRGEVCVGAGSLLSFAAVILLVFSHIGQINTSKVPRGLEMARVNVSQYGAGLGTAFNDPIEGLYTSNFTLPLGQQLGLRNSYSFGLYSYCGYVEGSNGTCSNHTTANRFTPYTAITSDMLSNYTQFTAAIIGGTKFNDESSLSSQSHAAYYLVLLGTIGAILAFLTGLMKHTITFFFSTLMSVLSSALLLASAAIWTAMIKKVESINGFMVQSGATAAPLGIEVSVGNQLFLIWAGFACMAVSVVPYMISCCTYRG